MKNHHQIITRILIVSALSTGLAWAQVHSAAPFTVSIGFTGQSSGDATKPNVHVTLTNVSDRIFQVLQPRSDGLLQNLQFMV